MSREIRDILFDPAITNQYPSLRHYFQANRIAYSIDAYKAFVAHCEETLTQTIRATAILMMAMMDKNDVWGSGGEQSCREAFCRHLLHIGASEGVGYESIVRFEELLEAEYVRYELNLCSPTQLKDTYRHHSLFFLGKKWTDPGPTVSALLRFMGSELALFAQPFLGDGIAYILGNANCYRIQDYDVLAFGKEIVRCPNYGMANPAIVVDRSICLRQESFEFIFFQKWHHLVQQNKPSHSFYPREAFQNIAEAIRVKTMAYYRDAYAQDERSIQTSFMVDMQETILKHELGHAVVNDRIFPYESIAVGEGVEHYYQDETMDAFLEFLADFAPENDGLCGPFFHFFQVAKTDKKRATRLFYMYLSDVFFYDTGVESMYCYSDLMCLTMLRYIQKDSSVDFKKMEADLQFNHEFGATKNSFFEKIHQLYWEYADAITIKAKQAKYSLPSGEKNFGYIRSLCLEESRKYHAHVGVNDKVFLSPFWINIYSYLDHFSKDAGEDMRQFVTKKIKKELLVKVMILSCGRQKAQAYQFDHRRYIQDAFTQLGFGAS